MNLFRQPKPRCFEHINIYADDRRERLRRMEQRVREELARKDAGESSSANTQSAEEMRRRLHEAFTGDMRHLKRRERRSAAGGGQVMNIGLIAIILLIILIVWRLLL